MPIRVLPADVVAKIAAGEVVERPVSVAKELLENAIDAGADEVRIEAVAGGRRLIGVSDNGCGIPAAEVETAVHRHATSKLASAEDLYRVRTLGFRGEALASIAAVSRLTLSTRSAAEALGTVLRVEGGVVAGREAQGRPPGTTVQVENLFFNTPARLRFLRTEATEANHIARLASSYALAYPQVRLSLQHGERSVLQTLGTGELADVLAAIYGLDVAEQMLPVDSAGEAENEDAGAAVRVWGYVGSPSLSRSNRQDITLLVNGRWVLDNSLAYAVGEAYHGLLPAGRHPIAVLHIALPAEEVDVNTHPTKREVRFREGRRVFAAVQRAVRTALLAERYVPGTLIPGGWSGGTRREPPAPGLTRPAGQGELGLTMQGPGERSIWSEGRALDAGAEAPSEGRLPMLRVLGQLAQSYIIAEGPGGLYLIDQHAAHERIRYEALRAQRDQQRASGEAVAAIPSQELLEPLTLELPPAQAALLEEHVEMLATYGLEMSPFGGNTYLVRRVPVTLAGGDVAAAVGELLHAAQEGGERFSWEEQTLITLACHSAVRAGQTLDQQEMRDLVRQLERAALPHACPHGRPTIVHLSHRELERHFGRR